MRDLYRRLGLEKAARIAAIREAIARCDNQTLKADADAVLTVAAHRVEYDELHDLLMDIGHLRVGLGLTHAPHWQGETASDFSLPPRQGSRQRQLSEKLEALAPSRRRRHRRAAWLLGALVLFVLGVIAGRLSV